MSYAREPGAVSKARVERAKGQEKERWRRERAEDRLGERNVVVENSKL